MSHVGSNVLSSTFVLMAILLLLSPVLQTLSKATTSDSIWPLSASLLGLNAILADYGSDPQDAWQPIQYVWLCQCIPYYPNGHQCCRFPSSLSVNAAISASVVLSSRLSSHLQVFALILFSIEWFALLPILRKEMFVSPDLFIDSLIALHCIALHCLHKTSYIMVGVLY